MRLSLKDLFAILTLVAVLSWCAAVGMANDFFWPSAFCTLIASSLFVGLARIDGRPRLLAALVPLAPLALCALPIASIALLLNLAALVVAGTVCSCVPRPSVKHLWTIALACGALGYAGAVLYGDAELRRLQLMRQEFQPIPLVSRLAYEGPRPTTSQMPSLSADVARGLKDWEQALDWDDRRSSTLKQIHRREYERFVRAEGFGVFRMPRPRAHWVRLPSLQEIAVNALAPPPARQSDGTRATHDDWDAFSNVDRSNEVGDLHQRSRDDFLDPQSFGALLGPVLHAAGFVEHAFHHSPRAGLEDPDRWTIESLELVSLLKYDEPRVYVLDHLPRMDQLSADDVPTRPLDEFESDALEKLRTNEDVVVAEQGGATRMLGSLRAANHCLECHSVQRGELLGAFTYVLHRKSAGQAE